MHEEKKKPSSWLGYGFLPIIITFVKRNKEIRFRNLSMIIWNKKEIFYRRRNNCRASSHCGVADSL
jgi:hypothetical protein